MKIGDKVVMNRGSEFFAELETYSSGAKIWWEELEEVQPLTVSSIVELEGEDVLKFKESDYEAMVNWVNKV